MKIKFLPFIIVAVLLSSCSSDSSDDNPNSDPENDGLLISRMVFNDSDGGNYTINFNYIENQLTTVDDNFGYESKYTYNSGRISKIENYEDDVLVEYAEIEYNTDGSLSNFVIYYEDISAEIDNFANKYVLDNASGNEVSFDVYSGDFSNQNELQYTMTYTYQDMNLVMIQSSIGSDQELFEYDNENGIYSNIADIEIIEVVSQNFESGFEPIGNTHNLTKITDVQFIVTMETMDYTYNDNDYPTSSEYELYEDGELIYTSDVSFFYE